MVNSKAPMVRHPDRSKDRRTRLLVVPLGHSRKSARLLTFASSTRRWAEVHEEAFRRLGGTVTVVILDNLRGGGVLKPDIYDPTLNPLHRDVLAHYGAVALLFDLDVLACPRCGGPLRVITTVQDPAVVRTILAPLARSGAPASPGPAALT